MLQRFDEFTEIGICLHLVLYALDSVDDRGVISAAKIQANGLQRVLGKVFAKVHGYLTGLHDLAFARFGPHLVGRNPEVLTDDLLNFLNR